MCYYLLPVASAAPTFHQMPRHALSGHFHFRVCIELKVVSRDYTLLQTLSGFEAGSEVSSDRSVLPEFPNRSACDCALQPQSAIVRLQ